MNRYKIYKNTIIYLLLGIFMVIILSQIYYVKNNIKEGKSVFRKIKKGVSKAVNTVSDAAKEAEEAARREAEEAARQAEEAARRQAEEAARAAEEAARQAAEEARRQAEEAARLAEQLNIANALNDLMRSLVSFKNVALNVR